MRRIFALVSMAVIGLVVFSGLGLSSCGYIALPGGFIANFAGLPGSQRDPLPEDKLKSRLELPEGFVFETWASGLPNPRLMHVTTEGDLLVSAPRDGKVFLVQRDRDGDGGADGVEVLLEGLDRPHGIDVFEEQLYVAEGTAVVRFPFDAKARSAGAGERIVTGLPDGGNHWTRTVKVGPDRRLYVAVGSSCNVCEEEDPRRAAIVRYELDGSGEELFATGLRNSVDFAWQPGTGDLYATNNGRDLLGDDFPPEALNRIVEGGFYGWPYANPPALPDPDFGDVRPDKVAATIPPVHDLPPHSAPLGITFYDGSAFPQRYEGAAFVALHGSWNRREKQGYEVVVLFFDADGAIRREKFFRGFELDEDVVGRPVGVTVGPEGELFVSDDFTGVIYRVTYGEEKSVGARPASAPEQAARPDPLAALPAAERSAAFERGAKLWAENACATCHVHGEKGAPPHKLADLSARYDLVSLDRFLQAPQPPMPLYPFSESQRRDLSTWLLTTYR